jgi:hypothetical protein
MFAASSMATILASVSPAGAAPVLDAAAAVSLPAIVFVAFVAAVVSAAVSSSFFAHAIIVMAASANAPAVLAALPAMVVPLSA